MPAAADLFGAAGDRHEGDDDDDDGALPPELPEEGLHGGDSFNEPDDETGDTYPEDDDEELAEAYGTGPPRGLRLGRNGPRQSPSAPRASGSGAGSSPSSTRSKAAHEDGGPRHRPRGNLPQAPAFDGDRKKDVKCFKHWVQKVDSYIEIAKKIIDDSEIGLRLHAALEGDAAEYLEDVPARTFGVPEGWRILIHVLQEKFDEKRMHKVGSAMRGFFRMTVNDKSRTLAEVGDMLDKAARQCKEAGLVIPDEVMTYMFFEHTNSSLERQANILLRTGGGYEWKKIKAAVDLLYPQTYVNARRGAFDQNTGRGYGKSRTAHETQGHWDGNETYDTEVDLETWLEKEDPVQTDLADADVEYLARQLHEVFATHRENRQKLAQAVKARGFYLKNSHGKGRGKGFCKTKGKGKGKSTSSPSTSRPSKGSSSSGKGKARGMSLDELKKITTCGEQGHWKGDPQCKGPKKAHETSNYDLDYEDAAEGWDDAFWDGWQEDEEHQREGWMTGGGYDQNELYSQKMPTTSSPKSSDYNAQAKPTNSSTVYRTQKVDKSDIKLEAQDALEVVRDINRMKRKVRSAEPDPTGEGQKTEPSKAASVLLAEHARCKDKPFDVFTATAEVQKHMDEKRMKARGHASTAPEAIKEARERLGLPQADDDLGFSVWDLLRPPSSSSATSDVDLDKLRVVLTVNAERPHREVPAHGLPGECLPRGLPHDRPLPVHMVQYSPIDYDITSDEDDMAEITWCNPRGALSNTRMRPTVQKNGAYLTIDTACENTVGGLTQLRHVAEILQRKFEVRPLVTEEKESYRFGPGDPRTSLHRWHVPVGIGGRPTVIKTSTLDDTDPNSGKIPWLAGQDWLRLVRAVIDVGEQNYLKALDAAADLFVDHTGHLVVAVDDFPAAGWPQDRTACHDGYAGVLWATGKVYTQPSNVSTHVYNPEDDPFSDGVVTMRSPCTIQSDTWEYHLDHPQVYVRHHHRPRSTRFTPSEVVDGPRPDELQPLRITIKHGSNKELVDTWDDTPQSEAPWTGYTILFGRDCDSTLDIHAVMKPWQPAGVDVSLESGETLRVHPSSVKCTVHKRVLKAFDASVHPPDLPVDRQAVRFTVPPGEFGSRDSIATKPLDEESSRPWRPRDAAMGTLGAQPPDLHPRGAQDGGFNEGGERVEVSLTGADGLCRGSGRDGCDLHGGPSTGFATGNDLGSRTDAPSDEPALPDSAGQMPTPPRTWKEVWKRPWQVFGVRQLWDGVARLGLHDPAEERAGDRVQGLGGSSRSTRRQGHQGRDSTPGTFNKGFIQQILWLLVFLATYVYGDGLWSSGLQGHQGQGESQGEGREEAHWHEEDFDQSARGLLAGRERRGHDQRGRVRRLDEPLQAHKLKPGQQKRMKNMARQALSSSKWQQKMVMQKLQKSKWPRSNFRFDLIEVFGGSSMVTIRGTTLWRMRALQPLDIRYGVDLRQRSMRRWLLQNLKKTPVRLAIVEYPCTPWTILQRNVNYKDKPEELEARQERDRPFLKLTEDIFSVQVQNGGHALRENPATADSQRQPEILRLREKYYETNSCLCMFGLVGKAGRPMMKRVRFIATHSYFIEELDAQCDGSHQHEPVQGSNTAASACYPPFLADAICRAFWRVVEQEDFGTQTFNEEEDYKTAWFVDADKSEDKWRPLFEEAMEVLGRKNQGSIFVPPDSPLYAKISALVPWQIMNIQLAHLPKAKRVRPGLEECHRCSVLLHADDSLTIETEHLKTAQAPRERFVYPVRLGIFVLGYPPGDPAEPAPQQEPPRQSAQADPTVDLESPILTKQSVGGDEQWFIGPPLNNKQKKLAPILAKLHKNLGHPSQADLTRALIQDGTVEPDATELSRRLRCATCERTKKPGIPRPTSFKVIGSFNSKLCLDFVYAPDANKDNFAFLHILEPNGSFNVFWPCPTREPGQIFDLVTLLWCSWAGFPKELWIDQDGAFQGEFAERMRNMGVNIDCPPAEAHWQVGQIEAYNRAFQHVASKLVDALNLAGERDMRTLACAVGAAMNDRIRSAGRSAYQWVFGKSPVLPQDILSPDGKFEALQAMELDDELKKRARTRALADEKLSAYRLNEAVRTAILRKSHPAKELYHPGELVAFWREAKYRQGKKGQKGKRIPASWYRGTIIGPHKGDSSVKQSNYWVASGGRCVLVAREQLRPAFGTELWPVHEHILQEFQENPPDKYYDLRSSDLPPVPEDDDLKDGEDQIPLFQDDDSVFNDLIDEFPEEQEAEMETDEADQHPPPPEPDGAASTGSDLTTLAAGTSTRAPGTPVTGIIRPPSSREESLAPPKRLKTTPSGSQASNPPEEPMVLEPATPPGEHNVELVHTDDKWKWLPDRALLLRQRLRPRRALYDPGRVRALPLPLDKWRTKRVTWMKTDTGWTKHVDDWVQRGAEVMGKVWTGVTIFSIIDKKSHVMMIHNVLEMQSEISRKERKALEKELPWSAIPEDQRELYRQALVKEWTTWLRYEAVRVLSWDCSRQVELSFDPARILAARACYRDKHAATPWLEIKPKARIVCRGDADPDLLELRRDAPTMTRLSLMILLQLAAAHKGWFIICADITGAFLQGDQALAKRKEPLFVRQPKEGLPGLHPGQLLLVVRGIFGLANSPRLFRRHLRDSMVKLGFMQSTLDKAVFLFYQDKRLVVAVGAHVDDLLCVGEPGVGDKVLERLRAQFDFGEWKDIREEPTLIYGGKEISKKGDIITLSQEAFIRALTLTPVPKWRTIMKDSALNAQETTELKSGGGCLHWLVGQTRPDLAAGTSLNMGGNPTIQNLLAINNLLKEALKSKDWALQFRPLDLTKARIIGFSDASWANTDDLKSQAGYLVFITGPEVFTLAGDVANLVEWRSHRIRRKCRSTLAAETMGLDAATDAVLFTRELLAEMLIESYQPTQSGRLAPEIFPAATATDCRSLYDLLVKDGPLGSAQEKRLTLDIGALREAAEELEPSGENVKDVYKWVSTHVQRADHLTKIKPQHELRKILDEGRLSMVAAEATPSTTLTCSRGVHSTVQNLKSTFSSF